MLTWGLNNSNNNDTTRIVNTHATFPEDELQLLINTANYCCENFKFPPTLGDLNNLNSKLNIFTFSYLSVFSPLFQGRKFLNSTLLSYSS